MPVTARPARPERECRSSVSSLEREPVGVVAVQADLAAGVGDELQGLRDAALVGLRLVAVLLVRVPGDHVEGRRDAAHVLAVDDLRERPERVGAARQVAHQPVGAVAELSQDGAALQVAGRAGGAVAGGGEAAPCPPPQVVQVVGERDREAAARSPDAPGGRQRLEAELGEARRQGAAQELGVAVHRRVLDAAAPGWRRRRSPSTAAARTCRAPRWCARPSRRAGRRRRRRGRRGRRSRRPGRPARRRRRRRRRSRRP